MTYFCPICFKKIKEHSVVCPNCHTDINRWERETSYESRLIQALQHPLSEVRMSVIITLGNMQSINAIEALTECAFRYPKDIIQNLEIIQNIDKTPSSKEKELAIKKFEQHPSKIIKKYIKQIKK